MATATAEKMVSAPSTDHVFVSRRTDLTLVMTRSKRVFAGSEEVETEYGHTITFVEGRLTVPRDPDEFVIDTQGERIPAPAVLDFLEGNQEKRIRPHRMLGNHEEGFWRYVEPAPAPSEDELTRVQVLAETQDAPGLEDFIAQEQAGWHRDSLLNIAKGSLERTLARHAEAPPAAD